MQIELSLLSRAHFDNFIFQKRLEPCSLFAISQHNANSLKFKPRSRYSLVRMSPTSSCKNGPIHAVFAIWKSKWVMIFIGFFLCCLGFVCVQQSGAVFLAICHILGLKSLIRVPFAAILEPKSLICGLFAAFWG